MVRWVHDTTGRFGQRPHYTEAELDALCESIILPFVQKRHGKVCFPIDTDDLTVLIDRDAGDLDLYADLSHEGSDVQGVTYFLPSGKPKVYIAKELSEQKWRAHRLRTTLTHEYGHVHFHAFLWSFDQPSLFPGDAAPSPAHACREQAIVSAPVTDWMEWQAGYVCGALLMPVSGVREVVSVALREWSVHTPLQPDTLEGQVLIQRVATTFDVSHEAATVRLSRLRYLGSPPAAGRLAGL